MSTQKYAHIICKSYFSFVDLVIHVGDHIEANFTPYKNVAACGGKKLNSVDVNGDSAS